MTQTERGALSRATRRWDIFLSHASEDLEVAQRLCTALELSGWTVFLAARDLPEQIEAAEWSQRIDEAMDFSGALVLLASPEALTKKWVTYEWRSFHNDVLADRGGWIVPCCIRGVAPDELVRALRHYQAVDFRRLQDWDTALTSALTLLEGHLKRPIRAQRSSARPRVLTIGGSGLRTILAATSLERIEAELHRIGTSIFDSFDLIVGDSAGAFIAARLAQGMSVVALKQELDVLALAMTERSSLLDRLYALYNSGELRKRLQELLGPSDVTSAPKCAISTFDLNTNQHRLWSHRLAMTTAEESLPLADLVAASIATPVYFEPITLTTTDGAALSLVDGSIWASDPARLGLDAIRKIVKPTPLIADILLVAVGSGHHTGPVTPEARRGRRSILMTGLELPDLVLRANREAIDEHVKGLYREAGALQNYIRFDPELSGDQDWRRDRIHDVPRMRSFAEAWVETRSDIFRHTAELIAHHAGSGPS